MTDTTLDAPAKSYEELDRADAITELRARDEALADTKRALDEAVAQRDSLRENIATMQRQARSFNETLLEALKEQVDAGNIDRDNAQEVAEALGLKLPGKYTVTVTIELTVEGVEAEDENEAESLVRNDLTIDCSVESEGDNWEVSDVNVEAE